MGVLAPTEIRQAKGIGRTTDSAIIPQIPQSLLNEPRGTTQRAPAAFIARPCNPSWTFCPSATV